MSAVRSTKSIPTDPLAARIDVQAMQDLLYDILATGVDAEQASVSVEAVERFLHEHARSPKSPEEFAAFFARQGLTISGRPPRPAPVVALPPIQRPAQAEAPVLKFPVELASPPSAAAESELLSLSLASPFGGRGPGASSRSWRSYLAWGSAAAALIAVGALAYVGYTTIAQLEQRLDRTHAAAQADREALQALEHQQVDIVSNVAASAQIIERMDQKSDLILDSIQAPPKKPLRRSYAYQGR
jgi:hypothetical protein